MAILAFSVVAIFDIYLSFPVSPPGNVFFFFFFSGLPKPSSFQMIPAWKLDVPVQLLSNCNLI